MNAVVWLTLAVLLALITLGMAIYLRVVALNRRDRMWALLAVKTPWEDVPFDPAQLGELPRPAKRLICYAVPPGSMIRPVAVLASRSNRGAKDHTVIAAPYGWLRRRYRGPYSSALGILLSQQLAQRWITFIPFASPRADDLAERAAIEAMLFTPAALCRPGPRWTAIDDRRVQVDLRMGETNCRLEVSVAEDGAIESVTAAHIGLTAKPHGYTINGGLRVPQTVEFERFSRIETVTLRHIRFLPAYKGNAHH